MLISGAILVSIVFYGQQAEKSVKFQSWSFILIAKLFYQAMKVATSIKVMESDHYDEIRAESREFLQSFYSQLINQPIVFTASGFYVINLPLLASIITGIVSYQIILVQFNAS